MAFDLIEMPYILYSPNRKYFAKFMKIIVSENFASTECMAFDLIEMPYSVPGDDSSVPVSNYSATG